MIDLFLEGLVMGSKIFEVAAFGLGLFLPGLALLVIVLLPSFIWYVARL